MYPLPVGRKTTPSGSVKLRGGTENFRLSRRTGWSAGRTSGGRDTLPNGEGARAEPSKIRRSQQVPSHTKEILDDAVKGEEPLCLTDRFEASHIPFSLASRLMGGFNTIVGVTFGDVIHARQNLSHG